MVINVDWGQVKILSTSRIHCRREMQRWMSLRPLWRRWRIAEAFIPRGMEQGLNCVVVWKCRWCLFEQYKQVFVDFVCFAFKCATYSSGEWEAKIRKNRWRQSETWSRQERKDVPWAKNRETWKEGKQQNVLRGDTRIIYIERKKGWKRPFGSGEETFRKRQEEKMLVLSRIMYTCTPAYRRGQLSQQMASSFCWCAE